MAAVLFVLSVLLFVGGDWLDEVLERDEGFEGGHCRQQLRNVARHVMIMMRSRRRGGEAAR